MISFDRAYFEVNELVACGSANLHMDVLRHRAANHKKRPRLHPNGFIQLDLNPEATLHLHVWPIKPLSAQKTSHPIHDHSFDMYSRIIGGSLTNHTFDFTPLSQEAQEKYKATLYKLHVAKRLEGQDTILSPTNAPAGKLETRSIDTYHGLSKTRNAYRMASEILHDSRPGKDGAVTIMAKYNLKPTYEAFVAVPVGVQPDNDFRRETISEEALWKHIQIGLLLIGYF